MVDEMQTQDVKRLDQMVGEDFPEGGPLEAAFMHVLSEHAAFVDEIEKASPEAEKSALHEAENVIAKGEGFPITLGFFDTKSTVWKFNPETGEFEESKKGASECPLHPKKTLMVYEHPSSERLDVILTGIASEAVSKK